MLLLLGLRLSREGSSPKHPFGRGKEQYFFAFVVTVLLFGVAGFASLREGYAAVGTPLEVVDVTVNYVVLGVALIFESYAFHKSYQGFRREADEEGFQTFFQTFRRTKDAPLLTAATENAIALVGVIVAITGIYLTDVTGDRIYDAVASAIIGLLLMGFALVLAWESKSLLVGEGVTKSERRRLVEVITDVEGVDSLLDLRTMHLGPDSVLVACDVSFDTELDPPGIEGVIDDIEAVITEALPEARRIYVEAETAEETE